MKLVFVLSAVFCAAAQQPKWTYPLPADDRIVIRKDIEYARADGTTLRMDLYRPNTSGGALPVVLFLNGVGSDTIKNAIQYTGWGRLVAGAGLAAVTFDTREGAIGHDTDALLAHLESRAAEYGIDAGNLLAYSCSANAGFGVPFVMQDRPALRGAVVYYGTGEIQRVRPDLPVFVVRASWDSPTLNRGIDRMVSMALSANAPWEVANIPGHHGFDIVDDTAAAHDAIGRTLAFLKRASSPGVQQEIAHAVPENRAVAALMAEDWSAAAAAYAKVVADEPANHEAVRQLGEARLRLGDYAGALDLLGRAQQMGNPNKGWIAFSAAICEARLNHRDLALKWLAEVPAVPGLMQRMRNEKAFDPLRDDPRFPAAGR